MKLCRIWKYWLVNVKTSVRFKTHKLLSYPLQKKKFFFSVTLTNNHSQLHLLLFLLDIDPNISWFFFVGLAFTCFFGFYSYQKDLHWLLETHIFVFFFDAKHKFRAALSWKRPFLISQQAPTFSPNSNQQSHYTKNTTFHETQQQDLGQCRKHHPLSFIDFHWLSIVSVTNFVGMLIVCAFLWYLWHLWHSNIPIIAEKSEISICFHHNCINTIGWT